MRQQSLDKLTTVALNLERQAVNYDRQHSLPSGLVFDQYLFPQRHNRLADYTAETIETIDELKKAVTASNNDEAAYLIELIENQLEAVIKFLHHPTPDKMPETRTSLYNELHQLKIWEQRLAAMVSQKRQHFYTVKTSNAESELLATEKRLQRCQNAIEKLQHQLPDLEVNHPDSQ